MHACIVFPHSLAQKNIYKTRALGPARLMMPVKLASSGRLPTHRMSALASRGLTLGDLAPTQRGVTCAHAHQAAAAEPAACEHAQTTCVPAPRHAQAQVTLWNGHLNCHTAFKGAELPQRQGMHAALFYCALLPDVASRLFSSREA